MVKSKGACEECELTCRLLHGCKKGLLPVVSRFIKVMIGTNFNEALFLPPKFVKNVKDLEDQEMKIEDSNGACWTVTLSNYKGKLAFHKGWDKFSDDKGLKIGDILVFNHIKDGCFVVQAFGRDACEKLNNPRKHFPVKRARISEKKIPENTQRHATHKDARKAEKREQLVDDELYMMVDRDAGYAQCDRTWLDLSNFEMQQNIQPVGVTKGRIDGQEFNSDAAQKTVKFQSDWDLNDNTTNEIMVSSMQTAMIPDTNIVKDKSNSEPTCNMSVNNDDYHLDDVKNDRSSVPSVRLDAEEVDDTLNVAVLPHSPLMKGGELSQCQCPENSSINFNKETETVKNVKFEIRDETYGCGEKTASIPLMKQNDGNSSTPLEISKTVRPVPVNTSVNVPSKFASSSVTYLVQKIASNNELDWAEECQPKVTLPEVFDGGEGRITVTFEDPEGREWAGVHCENRKFRALLASWDKIIEKNNIQPQHHYLVFSLSDVENATKFKFSIVP